MRRQLSTAFLLVAAGCAVLPEPLPQTVETPAEATRNVREAIELHLENLAAHR